jgi:CubicO group peptidase (beta-lactamase class C family)
MLLGRGELAGVRVLRPETVKLMTVNSLSPGVRFAQDMIGPAAGATWGLGFAIRTGAGSSVVPGSTGSFAWGGVWGTSFWVDPVEKLIAVQMIQVNPDESAPYRALGDLTYDALCRRYRDAH